MHGHGIFNMSASVAVDEGEWKNDKEGHGSYQYAAMVRLAAVVVGLLCCQWKGHSFCFV